MRKLRAFLCFRMSSGMDWTCLYVNLLTPVSAVSLHTLESRLSTETLPGRCTSPFLVLYEQFVLHIYPDDFERRPEAYSSLPLLDLPELKVRLPAGGQARTAGTCMRLVRFHCFWLMIRGSIDIL